ncbi:MAG: phosphate acyltransferase PlsX [Bacilli bacterium]
MIKLVIDCMGGDNSPLVNIEGTLKALDELKDLQVIFCGKEDKIIPILNKYKYDKERVQVVDAQDEITCHDSPVEAISMKKESSLVKSLMILKKDDSVNGLVSIGSTGAIISGGIMKIGRIKGIKRPAFCPILPTMNGGIVGICDSGANVDCSPLYLHQFALMGSLYLQRAYGIQKPRVALLNLGLEEEKGDILRKETYPLLKNDSSINFVGNMESRDFLSGKFDLVVCDGFAGNVLIKSTEGACLEMLKLLKKTFYSSLKNKLGALLLKKDIYQIKDRMDYNNYGGAVLLGVKKTIVKGHGNCKPISVYHCVKLAYTMEKNNLTDAIEEAINKNELVEE